MKLHEYQSKEIFRKFGIPAPDGTVTDNAHDAYEAAVRYNTPVMVKAQVLTGGRGKAGGVKYCPDAASAGEKADAILNSTSKAFRCARCWLRLPPIS